ncbi:MAG TPA: glycosyltransferase family 4 protein [Thermodesulfovibrionales bacterium]|nr:glycosyltransferase family 4 protein [Thermodesulfovibrionales bacterium]
MKLLHLLYESKDDAFGIGGVGIRAYEIYHRLKDRHDITLLCKRYPGAVDGFREGLKHIFVGIESRSLMKTLLSYAFHASRFMKQRGSEFDLIVEEFSPAVPTFLSRYAERPVILQVQGYTGKKYFEKYNILFATALYCRERREPKQYKNLIFVSDVSRRRFDLSPSSDVRVISNGISAELLDLAIGESDYILYLGRIDIHHKGLDILIRAFQEVAFEFSKIRLVVAGDGRDRKKLSQLLTTLPERTRENIVLQGWVDGDEKESLISNALFLVVPSRYETQGIVALEAMACGKALITSDITELEYVRSSGAGIAFRSGDAGSLAAAMRNLLLSKDRALMGEKGRESVRELTWENIALRYEDFLHDVLRKHSA